jgi:hypothetical protein
VLLLNECLLFLFRYRLCPETFGYTLVQCRVTFRLCRWFATQWCQSSDWRVTYIAFRLSSICLSSSSTSCTIRFKSGNNWGLKILIRNSLLWFLQRQGDRAPATTSKLLHISPIPKIPLQRRNGSSEHKSFLIKRKRGLLSTGTKKHTFKAAEFHTQLISSDEESEYWTNSLENNQLMEENLTGWRVLHVQTETRKKHRAQLKCDVYGWRKEETLYVLMFIEMCA